MKIKSEKRPWGGFEQFTKNEKSSVKILVINPKQQFSLQKHKQRKEFWKILEGNCKITIGKNTVNARVGDEFEIPKNTIHRCRALGKKVKILEIGIGSFDEKDIVRLKDEYGRT